MKQIIANSIIILLFIIIFLFKDNFFNIFKSDEYNFDYLKEEELNYYKDEYNRLSSIINLDNMDINYIYSKVIIHNIYDYYNKITILKGTKDNIKKGDYVLNEYGLIGIVSKVYTNYSIVKLLYSDLKLSVLVHDSYGILESKKNELIVSNIIKDNDIEIGDNVYTSNLDDSGKYLIGKVIDIYYSDDEIEEFLKVEPVVDYSNLKYVMIVGMR